MRFTIHFVNPKPKQLLLLWRITTDANIALNQSGFEAIACSQRQAQKMPLSKPGLDLGQLVLIGWESAGASFSIQSQRATMQNQEKHESRVLLTTINFRSVHFKALYTTLVIRNIAQTCDYRRLSKCSSNWVFACHARRFIGLICGKHFVSWFVFCIPFCFTISCNAHLDKFFLSYEK